MRSPSVAIRRAPRLAPGARVALVSPAGPLRGDGDLQRAAANAASLGWESVAMPNALGRAGYLAGRDDDRLADLHAAFADPRIDAIWCVRGGYGTMRLLHALDLDLVAKRPKPLLGYSDVTALHAAVAGRAGVTSFHAPVARAALPPLALRSLRLATSGEGDPCGLAAEARVLRPGTAEGRLAGGNLALVAALCGTPWMPDLDDAILVLEDVHEAVYRIDRMLRQLLLSGRCASVRGVVFGQFTDLPEEPPEDTRPLDEVLGEFADALGVPCIAGAPVGHVDEQWTIEIGADAALDADARTLRVAAP